MTTLTLDPPQGRSSLPFIDARHPQRPLEVNFYRPARHRPEDEVVFVQHGMLRNGDDYRDFWIDAAEKHNLLIVAPTFGNAQFPQAEGYNNGLVVGEDGAIAAEADWLYAVPARVLAALRSSTACWRRRAKRPSRSPSPPIPAGTPCRRSTAASRKGSTGSVSAPRSSRAGSPGRW
jgi:hypothetical protein